MFGRKKSEPDKFELLYMLAQMAGKLASEYTDENEEDKANKMGELRQWALKEMINELEEVV